jgi:hypothetical protein
MKKKRIDYQRKVGLVFFALRGGQPLVPVLAVLASRHHHLLTPTSLQPHFLPPLAISPQRGEKRIHFQLLFCLNNREQ